MRDLLKYCGAIMAVTTGISILACGGGTGPGGEDCTFDDECTLGFVCSRTTNTCTAECTDDNVCAFGETCQPRPNADGRICQLEPEDNNNDFNNNPSGECVENEDCTADVDGVCVVGVCEYPTPDSDYKVIQIKDTSSGNACSSSQNDPGSDIIGVALVDADGSPIGWGQVVNNQLGTGDPNDFISPGRIDGRPQSLRDGICPSETTFSDTDIYAMGCGGWMTVKFLDMSGVPLSLESGDVVEVYEFGQFCSQSGGDDNDGADSYEVYLCTDSEAALGGSDFGCDFEISDGQAKGFGQFNVTHP